MRCIYIYIYIIISIINKQWEVLFAITSHCLLILVQKRSRPHSGSDYISIVTKQDRTQNADLHFNFESPPPPPPPPAPPPPPPPPPPTLLSVEVWGSLGHSNCPLLFFLQLASAPGGTSGTFCQKGRVTNLCPSKCAITQTDIFP